MLLLQVINLLVEFVSFGMPVTGFLFIPLEPLIVLLLCFSQLFLSPLYLSLVHSKHLLYLLVKNFNLLIFNLDLILKGALLSHDLLFSQVALFKHLIVTDVSQRCL